MFMFYTGSQRIPSRSKLQPPLWLGASSGYVPPQLWQPKMHLDTTKCLGVGGVGRGEFIPACMTWVLQPKHPVTTSWKTANQSKRAVKFNVALEHKLLISNLNLYLMLQGSRVKNMEKIARAVKRMLLRHYLVVLQRKSYGFSCFGPTVESVISLYFPLVAWYCNDSIR